jgi:membrane-bound lytic murein transglycosylase D
MPPTPRLAALAFLGLLVAGCASEPARDPGSEWPMVPQTRVARPAALLPAGDAGASAAPAPDTTLGERAADAAEARISLPVPPDYTPMADLANVFDRIRLGYQLPEYADRAIDREAERLAAMPDFLDKTFERGEHYLYYVVRELEGRGMPLELAMLPVIESAYNPYAYSRARAAGIWQFIAPTATRYQVRVNWWQDGRRDIVDSTRAALDYLSELHTMFDGDWLKAIAAYNCGELAVQRAVDRNQRRGEPTDFWHLKLPGETRAYVPRLLALARIVANPAAYGLEFAPIANQPYFAQVEVGSQIDLRVAATLSGVGEGELHELNPAYNRWATDPDGPYHLLVPYATAATFAEAVAALAPGERMPVEHYTLQPGDTIAKLALNRALTVSMIERLNGVAGAGFRVGDELSLPAGNAAPLRAGLIIEGETPARGERRRRHTYVVRRGDTLASIARHSGVAVAELARMNGLAPQARLTTGHHLVVEPGAVPAKAALAAVHGAPRAARSSVRAARPAAIEPRRVSYVVRHGDTLKKIARRFEVSPASVRKWNRLASASLHSGQTLVLYLSAEQDYGG